MQTKRSDWHVIGSLALGAAAGFLAVKLMSKEDKQKINRWVNTQITKAEDYLSDAEIKDRLTNIYAAADARTREIFSDMYQGFISRVDSIRDQAKQIDRSKYREIVDDFTNELRQEGNFTREQISKLKNYLTQDYKVLAKG